LIVEDNKATFTGMFGALIEEVAGTIEHGFETDTAFGDGIEAGIDGFGGGTAIRRCG
jgi:hypothetical protein